MNKSIFVMAAVTAALAFGEDAAMKVVTDEANAVGNVIDAINGEEAKPAVEAEAPAQEEVEIPAAGEDVPDAPDDDDVSGITVTDGDDPDKITVSLDAVELEDVIRLFTRLSGANIICNTTNLHGTVTANLADIAWKPALKAILRQQGLSLIEDELTPGVYEIGPKPAKGQEPFVTKSFKLSYLKAAEAQKILTNFLGLNTKDSQRKVSRDKNGNVIEEVEAVANENKGYVVSHPAANTVIVSCRGENKMREVEQVIKNLDVVRQQVYIEAKIVQVGGSASKKIGLDWSFLDGYTLSAGPFTRHYTKDNERGDGSSFAGTKNSAFFNREYAKGSITTTKDSLGNEVSSLASAKDGTYPDNSLWSSVYRQAGAPVVSEKSVEWTSDSHGKAKYSNSIVSDIKTAIFDAPVMELAISALQTSDDVAQISNPKLIVANEERAVIDMSTKDPYVKVEETSEGTGTDTTHKYSVSMDKIPIDKEVPYIEGAFFSYGIRVDVTPRINNSTNITVVIEPTLSDFQSYYTPGDGNTRFPKISSKSVKTTFSLGNGQTAVIGGLTTTSDKEYVKKVPILGSIPLLKYLFSHTEKVKEQTETIIFVTVGIVDPNDRTTTMGLPDGARLVQKRIDENGKIIDKKFKEFDKNEEPAEAQPAGADVAEEVPAEEEALPEAAKRDLEEAKAEGVVVPRRVME